MPSRQSAISGSLGEYLSCRVGYSGIRPPDFAISYYRSWKMIGLHPVCAVLFTGGYALREYGAHHYLYNTQVLIIFVVSQVLIYVCP